jgi:16S rRNA (uracil1498-N3)-methyltransferase
MRVPRIYIPGPLQEGTQCSVPEQSAKHLTRVLRLGKGAPLIVFDGEGHSFNALIVDDSREGTEVALHEALEEHTESPLNIHLGVALAKGERMDYAIQKAVELGVNAITPLYTERAVVKLDAKREAKRLQHWQGVIQNACEQCGRSRLPGLHPVASLHQWLQQPLARARALFEPEADCELAQIEPADQQIACAIGPEGGWTPTELELMAKHDFRSVRLGPRVFRTETAVVAALTALQVMWGDLS